MQAKLQVLAGSNKDLQLWFDSSPCTFRQWCNDLRLDENAIQTLWSEQDPIAGIIKGSTTNPAIILNAVKANLPTLQPSILKSAAGLSVPALTWNVYKEMARRGAELLYPLFAASAGAAGWVSVQVDPRLTATEDIVAQGVELHGIMPNIQVKIPGTKQGIAAIQELTALGIATNATLCFTVSQLVAVAEAVTEGLAIAEATGRDLTHWRSNAIMMLGRFEEATALQQQLKTAGISLSPAQLRWVGLAVMKQAYRIYQERNFKTQLMAASMRVGPLSDGTQQVWHVQKLAGMNVVLTIFPNIWETLIKSAANLDYCPAADENIDEGLLATLLKLPLFRQAYEPSALDADDFDAFPPVVETREAFLAAMYELEELVGKVVNAA